MKSDWKPHGRQVGTLGAPGSEQAQNLVSLLTKAVTSLQAGDAEAARGLAKRALTIAPDNADCHVIMATACHNLSRLEDAERHYVQCLRLKPDHARARANLGMLQLNAERGDEAIETLQQAVAGDPDNFEARHYLARAYGLCDRFQEAIDQFKLVERKQPANLEVLMGYAKVLARAVYTDAAIEILQRAKTLHSKDHRIHCALGVNYASLGDFDAAEQALRKAIDVAPDKTDAYLQLAAIKRLTSDDVEILEQRLRDAGSMPDEGRAAFHYAMGAILEERQKYSRAFDAFVQANDIMDAPGDYDGAGRAAYFAQLTLATDGASSVSWPKGNASEKPIFIVGMPRSGTTLVEQILAAHPMVYAGGEQRTISQDVVHLIRTDARYNMDLEELSAEHLNELGAYYLDHLPDEAGPAVRVTDKMPGNVDYLPLIARMLPHARFILCRRHPMDVAWSIYKHRFGQALSYATNLANIAHLQQSACPFMDHWMAQMPDQSLEVFYEDLTENFEANARRIVKFSGLEWNDVCLEPHKVKRSVRTTSVWQVRQPVYGSSVGLWRNYEAQLADTKARLDDQISAYEARLDAHTGS